MSRSLSRGRSDPFFDSGSSGGGHLETLHGSFKKSSYATPRGGGQYSSSHHTPPRTPLLDRPAILDSVRSASRGGRFSGGSSNDYHFDDHRNPKSEGRSSFGYGRFIDDDDQSHVSYSGGSSSSSQHTSLNNAREVLSKMRHSTGGAGRYSSNEPSSVKSLQHHRSSSVGRGGGSSLLSMSSPRGGRLTIHDHHDNGSMFDSGNNIPSSTSQYALIGLKEELKKKDQETTYLRREITESHAKYVEDMKEMKAECEDAIRAMENELNEATRIKSVMESENTELKAECRAQIEELKAECQAKVDEVRNDCRAQLDEEKRRSNELTEELKKSKEEDLERLRSMYEEHLDVTKRTAADVEMQLKEEVRLLLQENERVKLAYEDYQKVLNDAVLWEKEANNYKAELDDVCDDNDKHVRRTKALEHELSDVKAELERMSSQCQRVQAERSRFEKEYDVAIRERDEALAKNEDLAKKLEDVQEERTLESRYTEALVKQRDNMNSLIESTQKEVEELKSMNMKYVEVGKEFRLLNSDPSTIREELIKTEKLKERVESLIRERERYNSTVKALKVDLKSMHGKHIGSETSLQDHMRYLNEKWEANESRLREAEKIKAELNESLQMIAEHGKERDQMVKIQRDLEESQTALVKMERENISLSSEVTALKTTETKFKTSMLEIETKLSNSENERKNLDADKRSLQAEIDKISSKKNQLEMALDNMEQIKRGLKGKLESAYYDLEVSQRDLKATRQEFEAEKSKVASKEAEIEHLNEMYNHARLEQAQTIKDAQQEVAESFKTKLRIMEEKHVHRGRQEEQQLRERLQELEKTVKEQKESIDQKSMAEIKRRGEFAKQKQELEILRSKERHLETHVNQLEEHISKVVADYEAKLQQSSNQTICNSINEETLSLKKQVRELEKKLEVSSAAMKQLGKSSLIMEKENGRLQNDKNELKLKLRKLVDCAEKIG
jgi:chromosome segregation ATPase